jgi:hypothetical protein
MDAIIVRPSASIDINHECVEDCVKMDSDRKNLLINILKSSPEIYSEVKKLAQNGVEIYQLINKPNNMELFVNKSGNFVGVHKKTDGQLFKHAEFIKAKNSPFANYANLVKGLASQALLIHIAITLEEVKKDVKRIADMINEDRIAELDDGISLFEQAKLIENDPELARAKLSDASDKINSGLSKLRYTFINKVNELPDAVADVGFFKELIGEPTYKKAEAKIADVEKIFTYALSGINCQNECYRILNEEDAGLNALNHHINKFGNKELLDKITKSSRLLKCDDANNPPQKKWKDFLEQKDEFEKSYIAISTDSVGIEFTLQELKEISYALK